MKDDVTTETVRAIEAIVLVAHEPVPTDLIAQLLEIPATTVDEVCARLAETYEEAGHGFQLAKVAGGWRFQTHPDLVPYVERFILDGQRARFVLQALTTGAYTTDQIAPPATFLPQPQRGTDTGTSRPPRRASAERHRHDE